MLQEIVLTPSTIVLLAVILLGIVFAIRRMVRRGLCDCSDHCDGCSKCKGSNCSECSAAAKMVESMNKNIDRSLQGTH